MVSSGITKEELIGWGGAEVFNQALRMCNDMHVTAQYDDETLMIKGAIERSPGHSMPVSLKLMPGGSIKSFCPCRTNQELGQVCAHVVALGICVMVNEMPAEDETPKKPSAPEPKAVEKDEPEFSYIEVPVRPRFVADLYGSRASLSIRVLAHYSNDVEFPICSLQPEKKVYLEDPDDPYVRHTRSIKAEREAEALVRKWGFQSGSRLNDPRLYLTDPHKVLTFLGSGRPELDRRGWRFRLAEPLSALTDRMMTIVPVVTLQDALGGAFDVHYEFKAYGEKHSETVSPLEIQAALNRGDGYILHKDQPILLDADSVNKIHDVFSDCASSQNGAARGWFRVSGKYASYVKQSLDELGAETSTEKAPQWEARTHHAGREDAKYEPVNLGSLETILRPYQKQGVYWMRFLENAGYSGLLADEMGLGKTLQTLTWLTLPRWDLHARRPDGTNRPALIVCPTSLVLNWEAEARKFTPELKMLIISGPDRAKSFKRIPEFDLVVTSYALLQRDYEAGYLDKEFSVVVLDEAQHIKNRQTRTAQAVKSLRAVQHLALTGTPVENSVADVWSIFDFLMPDYLGAYELFKLNYEDPILESEGTGAEGVLARLKRKISPFILRRLKKDVAKDLPDKIVKVSYCPMSDEAQTAYVKALNGARLKAGALVKSKGFARSKFEILAILMKLRQIASQAKVEPFMEQLTSAIEGGHKILVFSQFVTTLKILRTALKKANIPCCYLDGSTKDRLSECNRFNRTPEIPVFLISLMAGGTGLNLTGADMVMHYDPWWNPAVEDQATDRAHRIGQKKKVYVMKMIASGSIEERVLDLQRRKQAIIRATVDTTDAALMEKMTVSDLSGLLS